MHATSHLATLYHIASHQPLMPGTSYHVDLVQCCLTSHQVVEYCFSTTDQPRYVSNQGRQGHSGGQPEALCMNPDALMQFSTLLPGLLGSFVAPPGVIMHSQVQMPPAQLLSAPGTPSEAKPAKEAGNRDDGGSMVRQQGASHSDLHAAQVGLLTCTCRHRTVMAAMACALISCIALLCTLTAVPWQRHGQQIASMSHSCRCHLPDARDMSAVMLGRETLLLPAHDASMSCCHEGFRGMTVMRP